MAEPDELYTLRAQYWLGHYALCMDEAKAIARRPMSPTLKIEREEFLLRAHMALGQHDKVAQAAAVPGASASIQALGFRTIYETSSDDEGGREKALDELKLLLSDASGNTSIQLTCAHVFLAAGMTKEALQCVHLGLTLEHLSLSLQIYLKMDRLDLAAGQLSLMKQADEDSVVTQLGSVYLAIATGSSTAADATHHLNSMSEQYGPSPLLLNLIAASYMACGNFEMAATSLEECRTEHAGEDADTLVNTVVCYQHLGKGMTAIAPIVDALKASYPNHAFCQGLERVEGAFEREALKYKVTT